MIEAHAAVLASLVSALSCSIPRPETHQLPHHFVVGVADQRGRIAHLGHEAHHHQRLDVVGERGGRDLQLLLQAPDGKPGAPGADQRA